MRMRGSLGRPLVVDKDIADCLQCNILSFFHCVRLLDQDQIQKQDLRIEMRRRGSLGRSLVTDKASGGYSTSSQVSAAPDVPIFPLSGSTSLTFSDYSRFDGRKIKRMIVST